MEKQNVKMNEWFVVFDGPGVASTPVSFPGHQEKNAWETFAQTISSGFADQEAGLFLVKLTDVRDDQWDELTDLDSLSAIVASGFAGYTAETIEEYVLTD